ncbi:MAG: TraB/GumN family protein [Chitinophagaceae bacterium]|nr:TraB/GumN family protein [Chitinophagaceae bacterium]
MNRKAIFLILLVIFVFACKQKDAQKLSNENSLLWKVSGNGLNEPSYLYGTMHIICKEDALLSENFISVIKGTDAIVFEIDMENIGMDEMMESLEKMKMKGDTTLEDLLDEADLANVKEYIEEADLMLPYSELKSYLPILAYAILAEGISECEESTGIEEEITSIAKKYKKKTFGIETLEYQMGVMDSISYSVQANMLADYIDSLRRPGGIAIEKEKLRGFNKVYTTQNLDSLNKLIVEIDPTFTEAFADILLYNRNRNWVAELKKLMKEKSLVLAVGAGHLPGKKGLIDLLRKEGYEVTPVENNISPKKK